MRRTMNLLLLSAAAVWLPFSAIADDGGIQQVSAESCGSDGCGSCGTEGCCDAYCDGYGRLRNGRRSRRGDYCDAYGGMCDGHCDGRRCNFRSSSRDFALNWCGPCGPIGRLARWGCPAAQKLCWCCNTKAYPDSGWAPPAHTPIHRSGGAYDMYSHGQFGYGGGAGYGPGAPMVYQPTDTTQLGYSYANVPTWKRNPHKIPSVPNPSNFHARFCPCDTRCGSYSTMCPSGACMTGGCPTGGCMDGQCYGGMIMGQTGKSQSAGFVSMARQPRPSATTPPIGLQVRAVRPVERTVPKQSATTPTPQPQISTVSSTKPIEAAKVTPPQPVPPVLSYASQPPVPPAELQSQRPLPQQSTQGAGNPSNRIVNRSAGRRTSNQRPQSRKSGGWLGLPSLSDITF